jgi:hypothetical protein
LHGFSQSVVAAEVEARFDPACLPWDSARYQAEKLFLTVSLDLRARILSEVPATALHPVEGRPPLQPGRETLELAVVTRGPGWRELDGRLLLDAPSGGILQYTSLRQPSPRFRSYRFTATGPQRWTAKPLAGELDLPPERWSDVDVRQRTYAGGAVNGPVIEVSTLLYLLAASPLATTGDVLRINGYATSADELYDVTATVGEALRLAVDYEVTGAGESGGRRGVIRSLPIRVEGRSRDGSGGSEGFDILGLHDVEFLLDPERRVIAALRARVPAVGAVQFQLRSLGGRPPPARCSGR